MDSYPTINVWTDGSGKAKPSPAGFAAVIIDKHSGEYREVTGSDPCSNSQRAELQAFILALQSLQVPSYVFCRTDSAYLADGATTGLQRWQARGWRSWSGTPIANMDLWVRIRDLMRIHPLVVVGHVRGHQGEKYNEVADRLSRAARTALERAIACPLCEGDEALRPCAGCGIGF
jgi:ribonuclease HI